MRATGFFAMPAVFCRAVFLTLFLTFIALSPSSVSAKANCGECPEKFCTDPSYAKKLKAEKKRAAEASGLPARLSAMFDQLGDCEACIATAPDWPHITWTMDRKEYKKRYGEDPGYDRISRPWNADTELRLRNELKDGLIKSFHIYLGADTCKCCPTGADMGAYTAWKAGEDVAAESRDTYNGDKGFDDTSPQHNYDDKRKLGEDPKDLTEVSERNRRPNELRDPGVEEYPAERRVHVTCRECEDLEEEYNDAAEELDDMRRALGQAKRNVSLMAQAVDFVWNDMYHNDQLAQTDATSKKNDELMKELSTRQSDYNKALEKYTSLKKKWDEGHTKLKALMASILECEKDKCKKPVDEKKTAEKVGDDAKVEDKSAEDKAAEGTKPITPNANLAGDPFAALGGYDADNYLPGEGDSTERFVNRRAMTTCTPCQKLLSEYKDVLQAIDWRSDDIKHLREGMKGESLGWRQRDAKKDPEKPGTGGLRDVGHYLGEMAENEANYEPIIKALQEEIDGLVAQARQLAAKLVECEKEKCTAENSTFIKIGGGGDVTDAPKRGRLNYDQEIRDTVGLFPFPWNGLYETTCHKCKKLADALNRTYYQAEAEIHQMRFIPHDIAMLEKLLALKEDGPARAYMERHWDERNGHAPSTRQEIQTHLAKRKEDLKIAKARLDQITAYFHQVLAMYEDCLKKYCGGDTANGTAVRIGSDAEIKIEQANRISGTNPHNVQDVESAGVNRRIGTSSSSSSSGVVVTPPSSSGVVSSSSSGTTGSSAGASGSSASSSGTPPVEPPFQATATGQFSFNHTVGSSPCPQPAGTVTVTSNNGNPLTISNISVSASISSRVNVSAGANGTTSPTLSAQFNCSSAQNGNFSGTVSATITDTVTGETQTIVKSVSGSVNG